MSVSTIVRSASAVTGGGIGTVGLTPGGRENVVVQRSASDIWAVNAVVPDTTPAKRPSPEIRVHIVAPDWACPVSTSPLSDPLVEMVPFNDPLSEHVTVVPPLD